MSQVKSSCEDPFFGWTWFWRPAAIFFCGFDIFEGCRFIIRLVPDWHPWAFCVIRVIRRPLRKIGVWSNICMWGIYGKLVRPGVQNWRPFWIWSNIDRVMAPGILPPLYNISNFKASDMAYSYSHWIKSFQPILKIEDSIDSYWPVLYENVRHFYFSRKKYLIQGVFPLQPLKMAIFAFRYQNRKVDYIDIFCPGW